MNYKENFAKWLSSSALSAEEKEELSHLCDKEKEDRFYKCLSFGTGGLRGVMAVGSNRMNLYTVRRAAEGGERRPTKYQVSSIDGLLHRDFSPSSFSLRRHAITQKSMTISITLRSMYMKWLSPVWPKCGGLSTYMRAR